MQVGVQRGSEKRRSCVRVDGILKRISRPGKGSAALRETLSGEAFRCECSSVAEELKALVRSNGRDVVRAAELDESRWCWRRHRQGQEMRSLL